MSHILEKVSFENKKVYVLGEFSINLLNYLTDRPTAEFFDNINSNSYVSYIPLPTHFTPRSKMLIDYIFFNDINETITSNAFN